MPESRPLSSQTAPPSDRVQPYDLTMPPQVRFGPGRIAEVGQVAATLGRRVWLVTGGDSFARCGGREPLLEGLATAGLPHEQVARSAGEPTVAQLAAGLASLPTDRVGVVVVAVGGGATIDLAKALAALATNVGACDEVSAATAVIDRLEGVGRGLPITRPPLPVVAVPTTAGTGAEATRNAVISCPSRRFKKSLRSPLMVPRAAVIDPLLTRSCSRETTAAAGLDCLTQLIESFISRRRWPLPQTLVLEAFPRAFNALPRVLADCGNSLPPQDAAIGTPENPRRFRVLPKWKKTTEGFFHGQLDNPADDEARAAMSHAAFISGVALGNSGLGLAHGVAAALGVECGTPHGLACAVMLPLALKINRQTAVAELARLDASLGGSGGSPDQAAGRLIERVEGLCRQAGIPRSLSELGLTRDRLGWLAEHSGGNSMRGNPVQLAPDELRAALESIY